MALTELTFERPGPSWRAQPRSRWATYPPVLLSEAWNDMR